MVALEIRAEMAFPNLGAIGPPPRALRSLRPFADGTVSCRAPDAAHCAGCETGELAGATPIEHCCADSCPTCNRTGRCVSRAVFAGDPLLSAPSRREDLEAYLGQKDRLLPPELKKWRALVGRPRAQPAKQRGGGGGVGRGGGGAGGGRGGASAGGGKKPTKPLHVPHPASAARRAGGAKSLGARQANGTAGRARGNVGMALRPRAATRATALT